ncbi:PREDICTED: L-rhamnose-binding lectin CSL2-like [Cyprinodon variegatus]|uniref:L-rhamnose-binding lectin CSL2-like n=1 Tax=Cyprinodon variegatus TaxID=28743 RepID=UPI0007429A08|nr:PREDICTED: L-rhamnose-binding lectin CSL2-like [Cyprinodon variegatus]
MEIKYAGKVQAESDGRRAAPPRSSIKRVITCDDSSNVHRLSCESGVIHLLSVLYGRADTTTCGENKPRQQLSNTECSQDGSLDKLLQRCEGRKVCEVNAAFFRTSDPCVGIYKYVDTHYVCIPAVHTVTCEDSVADLQCDFGPVISVIGAFYGRSDPTTCSFQRPSSQLQKTDCLRPSSEVSARCDGKHSCSIKASNSVFKDPCYGTYKYLEVSYSCVCK